MAVFGYAKVSSNNQDLDYQIHQLKEVVPDECNIVVDNRIEKNYDRKCYNALVGTSDTNPLLREGDLLIVTSLDRLGRNYIEIHEQWRKITNEIKADIRVLEIPTLDTSIAIDNLDKRYIADLVLQILDYTAEKERIITRERQRQGIEAAKKSGKKFGRPVKTLPENYEQVIYEWQSGRITAKDAMERTGLKRTNFYKKFHAWKAANSRH